MPTCAYMHTDTHAHTHIHTHTCTPTYRKGVDFIPPQPKQEQWGRGKPELVCPQLNSCSARSMFVQLTLGLKEVLEVPWRLKKTEYASSFFRQQMACLPVESSEALSLLCFP